MRRTTTAWVALTFWLCGNALAQALPDGDEAEDDEAEPAPEQVLEEAPPGAGAQPAPAGAQPPLAATGSRMSGADAQALLAHHNRVRSEVGVPPLAWSAEVAAFAQDWTDQLARNGCGFAHRQNNRYGENLFMGTAGAFRAVDGSIGWANEKKDWPGGVVSSSNYAKAGHYTQMVWRATTVVGCGETVCNGQLLVACNYAPPGNLLGAAPY